MPSDAAKDLLVIVANGDDDEAVSGAQVLAYMILQTRPEWDIVVAVSRDSLPGLNVIQQGQRLSVIVSLTHDAVRSEEFAKMLLAIRTVSGGDHILMTTRCQDFQFPALLGLIEKRLAESIAVDPEEVRAAFAPVVSSQWLPFSPAAREPFVAAEAKAIVTRLEDFSPGAVQPMRSPSAGRDSMPIASQLLDKIGNKNDNMYARTLAAAELTTLLSAEESLKKVLEDEHADKLHYAAVEAMVEAVEAEKKAAEEMKAAEAVARVSVIEAAEVAVVEAKAGRKAAEDFHEICTAALNQIDSAHAHADVQDAGAGAEQSFPCWFIGRDELLNLPDDQPMPHHQTLKKQGKLELIHLSLADVVSGAAAKSKAAVSHRWVTRSHVDPHRVKLRKLKMIMQANPHITHVWMDWICTPQKWNDDGTEGRRTFEEQKEFKMTLANTLSYIYLGCTVFVLFDADYNHRFWPCVEVWMSMRKITQDGLAPASRHNLRAKVYGVGGSEDHPNLLEYLCGQWLKKSADEALATLRGNDYLVTNQKDKDLQLQKLRELDALVVGAQKEQTCSYPATPCTPVHNAQQCSKCGVPYCSEEAAFCHKCGSARGAVQLFRGESSKISV